jgi:uncharacterized RDD family membrane protein YckC
MTLSADAYIARVLAVLPPNGRLGDQIAMELRSTIAERVAAGQTVDAALSQLGDPVALAESYMAAVPLVAGQPFVRLLARLIDFALATLAISPVAIGVWVWGDLQHIPWGLFVYLLGSTTLVAVYPMVAEAMYGRTLGKHLFGLRVVRESGTRISAGQAVVRNLPIFLQVFWIDALFALFTEKRQRAFELLSKTRVVHAARRVCSLQQAAGSPRWPLWSSGPLRPAASRLLPAAVYS